MVRLSEYLETDSNDAPLKSLDDMKHKSFATSCLSIRSPGNRVGRDLGGRVSRKASSVLGIAGRACLGIELSGGKPAD